MYLYSVETDEFDMLAQSRQTPASGSMGVVTSGPADSQTSVSSTHCVYLCYINGKVCGGTLTFIISYYPYKLYFYLDHSLSIVTYTFHFLFYVAN